MNSTLSRRAANFVHDLNYDELPKAVIEKVKTLFLHGIGVALASYDTETAQMAIEVAKKEGRGKAMIIIDGSRVTATGAAFANATLFHSRAQEDDYQEGLIHPGVVIIPAALAIGQTVGASGKDLIVALTCGFEVIMSLSKNFGRISASRGFRSTSVYGPLGAAATVAKLLNLDKERITFSLGWASNLSSGLLQCAVAKTPEMPLQAGLASQNGILATRLATVGAPTAEDMLEGEKGFYFAFCGSTKDTENLFQDLKQNYKVINLALKRYPVGGAVQSSTSAILSMVQENNVNPEDVEKIELSLPTPLAQYPGINSLRPGLISAQYCLAVACVHRKVTLRTVADMNNHKVKALMPKISVIPDEHVSFLGCRLAMTLKDGRIIKKDMQVTYRDYSFSFDEEQKHIQSLIPEICLPARRVKKIIDLIANMEEWKSMDELMNTLSYPKRKGERIRLPF